MSSQYVALPVDGETSAEEIVPNTIASDASELVAAKSKWALGIFYIVLVSVIWSAASVIVQWIFSGSGGFDSPLALTYICNAMFTIYLPGYILLSRLRLVQNPELRDADDTTTKADVEPVSDFPAERTSSGATIEIDCSTSNSIESSAVYKPPAVMRSHWSTVRAAAYIAPVWFAANLCYNASLRDTTVTSSTIISCTSSLWTLVLSVIFTKERLTWRKALGVALSILGGTVVGLVDRTAKQSSSSSDKSLLGDLLAVASAALYGVYSTLLAVHVPEDGTMAIPLLFGYLGALSAVVFAPLFALDRDAFSGLTLRALGLILLTGVFDNVIADLLWARAVVLTSATVASVGLSLTIPLAFVTDLLLHSIVPSPVQAFGAALVVSGFVLTANAR